VKRIGIGLIGIVAIVGIAYFAALGCCQWVGFRRQLRPLTDRLQLTPTQRQAVASLEKEFLARKEATCQTLCAKRAQLVQLLKQPEPDSFALKTVAEEIGREQTSLERATLDHLLALRQQLDPPQREELMNRVSDQLRTACKATACGMTPGCALKETKE
jgi:Spy/CpxP family protein refolding chaperone